MHLRPRSRVTLVALLLALFTPPALARPRKPVPLPLEKGKPYVHEPSGWAWPAAVAPFDRVSAYRYDDEGDNVSVGYNEKDLQIVVTAYVYPNPGVELDDHFEQVKRDVAQVHPDAEPLAGDEQWKLRQDDKEYAGRKATLTFTARFGAQERKLISQAYLLTLGDRFIKFRVTYPEANREAAETRIAGFLESFTLPEEK